MPVEFIKRKNCITSGFGALTVRSRSSWWRAWCSISDEKRSLLKPFFDKQWELGRCFSGIINDLNFGPTFTEDPNTNIKLKTWYAANK